MATSRARAIRIIIATAAVSLLLSAVCCAAFVMNVVGLMHGSEPPAQTRQETSVSITWCSGAGDESAAVAGL